MFIYKITNNISGKSYVGQTKQRPNQRFCRHISDSRKNYKKQAIHLAIAKYGIENFTFEVIDGANSETELNYKEVHYIHKFNSLYPNGYNLKLHNQPHTNTRKKLSEYMKANCDHERMKRLTELSKARSCSKVRGLSETGEEVILTSVVQVKEYGGSPKHLSAMLSGKKTYKQYVGYFFEYINKPTSKKVIVPKTTAKRVLRQHIVTGEVKQYERLKDIAIDGFRPSTVSSYINNRKANHSQYSWKYI